MATSLSPDARTHVSPTRHPLLQTTTPPNPAVPNAFSITSTSVLPTNMLYSHNAWYVGFLDFLTDAKVTLMISRGIWELCG